MPEKVEVKFLIDQCRGEIHRDEYQEKPCRQPGFLQEIFELQVIPGIGIFPGNSIQEIMNNKEYNNSS